ncbi:MAG: hypothetical protein ACTSRG_22770 [Candidatus Helarchaeota archaeon]
MPKSKKEKSLEEIYKEAREQEGPVIIPSQVDPSFLKSLEKLANIDNFIELLKEFEKYQNLALKKPGKIVEGNMILGAPAPKYWEPSEEEKRLVEIGKKIGMVLQSIDKKNVKKIVKSMITNEIFVDQIIFQDIQFFYVDVVGSGRFIYPQITWDIAYSILDLIDKAVNKKIVKKQITKIRAALNEPKIAPKKDLFSLRAEDKPDKKLPKYKVTKTITESKDKKSIQEKKELFNINLEIDRLN